MSFRSAVSKSLLNIIPGIRGSSIAASWLFKLLPLNPFVDVCIGQKSFCLDLRYRSQLAILKGWPVEPDEMNFVSQQLKSGDVFFDLGSNWGLYTAIASSMVGDDGLVVAVELNPVPFAKLLKLINSSGSANVLALNVGLSNVSADVVTIENPWYRNDTGGFISSGRGKDQIATRSLDKLWKQLGCPLVRMVKLDVEGFEPQVIAGGKEFLTNGVTNFVLVEVSEWTKIRSGIDYTRIYQDLMQCGFLSAYAFDQGKPSPVAMGKTPLPVNSNILFSKEVIGE